MHDDSSAPTRCKASRARSKVELAALLDVGREQLGEWIVERHEKARAEAKRTRAKPISVERATSWRAAALRFEGNPPKA